MIQWCIGPESSSDPWQSGVPRPPMKPWRRQMCEEDLALHLLSESLLMKPFSFFFVEDVLMNWRYLSWLIHLWHDICMFWLASSNKEFCQTSNTWNPWLTHTSRIFQIFPYFGVVQHQCSHVYGYGKLPTSSLHLNEQGHQQAVWVRSCEGFSAGAVMGCWKMDQHCPFAMGDAMILHTVGWYKCW